MGTMPTVTILFVAFNLMYLLNVYDIFQEPMRRVCTSRMVMESKFLFNECHKRISV